MSTTKMYSVDGIEILPLNAPRSTKAWTATGINSTGIEIRVAATVPGGIYSDLEDGGILTSPIYHEYNDVENRWVGRTDWNYSRSFTGTGGLKCESLLGKAQVVLVCDGLDTIGSIYVNDLLIGSSQNMFVRYIFDIKAALRVGQNSIRVAFTSPVEYTRKKYDEHVDQRGYPVLPEDRAPEFRWEPKGQMIRKMPASFGWDWGPSYPTSGIWRDIYIQGYEVAVIRDVLIFTTPSQNHPDESDSTRWNVTARIYYDAAVSQSVLLRLHREGLTGVVVTVELVAGRGNAADVSVTETGANTRLWWPNGYGGQFLYKYNVSLLSETGAELSTRELRVGFRTLELVEDMVDAPNPARGNEFYFKVNGIPIYSKGSNANPTHILQARVTREQEEWLLRSAKETNMNIVRVWGGGVSASDDFFDYADEYGLLIWYDFAFAIAMYPATPEFLADVRQEVDTQVKRTQHRASLACRSGNNGNEQVLREDNFGTGSRFQTYHEDYVKLYVDTIKELTEELDPSRRYLPSTATNGRKTEEEGWVAENPADLKYGDIHYFRFDGDIWDWRVFLRPRYASEFGFQSWPHYDTLARRADNISSWTWDSPQMDHRQRKPGGQTDIREFIRDHLLFPEDYNSTEAFPHMLYMSQIVQAVGIKTQTESYRRLVDKLDEDGTGHNMGALFWQLTDIWDGASWSSMETSGRWKMLLHYAKKFFAKVLASPYRDSNGDVVIELVSDEHSRRETGTLTVQIFKLSDMTAVYSREMAFESEFLKSKEVHRISNATLAGLGCAGEANSGSVDPCVVYTRLSGFDDNFLFLQYPRNKVALKDPNLKIEGVEQYGSQRITFRVTSEAIAPFVFLTIEGCPHGYFSDNGFLQTTGSKEVTYFCDGGITVEEFVKGVKVMSLFNVTAVAEEFKTSPSV